MPFNASKHFRPAIRYNPEFIEQAKDDNYFSTNTIVDGSLRAGNIALVKKGLGQYAIVRIRPNGRVKELDFIDVSDAEEYRHISLATAIFDRFVNDLEQPIVDIREQTNRNLIHMNPIWQTAIRLANSDNPHRGIGIDTEPLFEAVRSIFSAIASLAHPHHTGTDYAIDRLQRAIHLLQSIVKRLESRKDSK